MTDLMQQETRCTARRKNGEPCRNWAIHGSNVCRMHGGAAPQVRRAAQVRALMSSDRLMAQLIQIAEDQTQSAKDRLAAIVAVLDRAGIGTRQQVDVDVQVGGQMSVYERVVLNSTVPVGTVVEDEL